VPRQAVPAERRRPSPLDPAVVPKIGKRWPFCVLPLSACRRHGTPDEGPCARELAPKCALAPPGRVWHPDCLFGARGARAVPLSATELKILTDFIEEVRKLAVQTQKMYLGLEAMRMILVPPLTVSEDELRELIRALDDSTADEMAPDRPSVAGIDSVRRRLLTLST
jgi:hypothetical protein